MLVSQINQAVVRLLASLILPFARAVAALEKVGQWNVPSDVEVVGSDIEVLNSWLEHQALADLGKKGLEVSRVVAAIQKKGGLERYSPLARFLPRPQDRDDLAGRWKPG